MAFRQQLITDHTWRDVTSLHTCKQHKHTVYLHENTEFICRRKEEETGEEDRRGKRRQDRRGQDQKEGGAKETQQKL